VGSFASRGVVALVVLAVAVSVVSQVGAQQPLYTAAATEPCLRSLPTALVGLPPATPPPGFALWVYRAKPDHVVPAAGGTLSAYKGTKGSWQGITLTFFKTVERVRAYAKLLSYERPVVVRNVMVGTERAGAPWQKAVVACLRGGAPRPTPPPRPVPKADLATFVGHWGGHTRGLRISADGRGREYADSGCCMRAYDLSFQIETVTGTIRRATATYRVTRFKRYPTFDTPVMYSGQMGELRLRDGVLTNRQSDDYFCSDPAWGATGVCGL
jgi:hypothetical protein